MSGGPELVERGDGIFTIRNFAAFEECEALIRHSERAGYEPATIVTASGQRIVDAVRNNARVIEDDHARASLLWKRVREHMPPFIAGRQAVGVNERFRFYRYDPAERFSGHTDAPFRRDNGEQSLLTFMVYLNAGFDGGETSFRDLVVTPETGMALLFRHELFHEGRPIRRGRKYVLRTDVMFNPPGRVSES